MLVKIGIYMTKLQSTKLHQIHSAVRMLPSYGYNIIQRALKTLTELSKFNRFSNPVTLLIVLIQILF